MGFDCFFQGTQGNDIFALMKYDWYFGGANSATLKDAFYNSWTPQNPNAEAPKLNSKNSSRHKLASKYILCGGWFLFQMQESTNRLFL